MHEYIYTYALLSSIKKVQTQGCAREQDAQKPCSDRCRASPPVHKNSANKGTWYSEGVGSDCIIVL